MHASVRRGRPLFVGGTLTRRIVATLRQRLPGLLVLLLLGSASWQINSVGATPLDPGTAAVGGFEQATPAGLPAPSREVFADGSLREAFALAYAAAPEWHPVADAALERGVRVRWDGLPADVVGRTTVPVCGPAGKGADTTGGSRVATPLPSDVVISSRLRPDSPSVVAAILAHELYHAALASPADRIGEPCIQEELAATEWSILIWTRLPRESASQPSGEEDRLDDLARLKDWGRLEEWVRGAPVYREACGGG